VAIGLIIMGTFFPYTGGCFDCCPRCSTIPADITTIYLTISGHSFCSCNFYAGDSSEDYIITEGTINGTYALTGSNGVWLLTNTTSSISLTSQFYVLEGPPVTGSGCGGWTPIGSASLFTTASLEVQCHGDGFQVTAKVQTSAGPIEFFYGYNDNASNPVTNNFNTAYRSDGCYWGYNAWPFSGGTASISW